MNTADLLLLATVCCLGMLSPGPDFVLVMRNALTQPRAQALATAFGIVTGCMVHATYCLLGLAWLITQSVLIYATLKYLGAAYLIYIGVKGLLAKPKSLAIKIAGATPITVKTAFTQGFLCNVLNPKLAVVLLSLFTQFIKPDSTFTEKTIFAAIFVGEAAIYWPLLVLALHTFAIRNIFSAAQTYIDKISGVVLIGLGLRVALSKS